MLARSRSYEGIAVARATGGGEGRDEFFMNMHLWNTHLIVGPRCSCGSTSLIVPRADNINHARSTSGMEPLLSSLLSVLACLSLASLSPGSHIPHGSTHDASSVCREAGSILLVRSATFAIQPVASEEDFRGVSTSSHVYAYDKGTRLLDDAEQPVPLEVLRPGTPVTVEFVSEGGRAVATRVIVPKQSKRMLAAHLNIHQ